MTILENRRKFIKDNLESLYGIICENPVDYEENYIGDIVVVLELNSIDPPQGFHYSLIAKTYKIDLFQTEPNNELVKIEYLGGVLKWWD